MANKPGRPVTKNRWDEEGNPNFKRCGVYLETRKWEIFNLITRSEDRTKNEILEDLIDEWVAARIHLYPELQTEPEELILPEVVL